MKLPFQIGVAAGDEMPILLVPTQPGSSWAFTVEAARELASRIIKACDKADYGDDARE